MESPMNEAYLRIDDKLMYCRHNGVDPKRTSLLFVHGLGDSGLSFEDPFRYKNYNKYNIIVPDLIGYGRSSGSINKRGYSYSAHVKNLRRLIKELDIKNLIVIGHSMGGDLTTLLCVSDPDGIIKKYVCIEGDVTQYDLTISRAAMKAIEKDRFDTWYENDFKTKLIWNKLGELRSGKIYYASLAFCRKTAFIENAKELVKRNTSLDGKYKSEIGKKFVSINVPKIFCYGTASLAKSTLKFLEENNIPTRAFKGAGHCPMTDCSDQFYKFLYEWIKTKE